MDAVKRFEAGMVNEVEKNIDAARATEQFATETLINTSRSAEERAQWEAVAADEARIYEQKKAELARMRAEAEGEAAPDAMAA